MIDVFTNLSTWEVLWVYLPKIFIATLCGGVVGFERERKHKAAGIKTNIMVCVGSVIFAATAMLLASNNGDPTRMIAQIITGIGFLGAGAIFRDEGKVRGLTTASLIWILGAIGIVIAAGGYIIALVLTFGLVVLIWTIAFIEQRWFKLDDLGHD